MALRAMPFDVMPYMDPISFDWVLRKVGGKPGSMARLIPDPVLSGCRFRRGPKLARFFWGEEVLAWALVNALPRLTQRLLRHRRDFEV
jgi:hypothetical protein